MMLNNKYFLHNGWVYFKLYCEEINCETILRKFLPHFANGIKNQGLIQKFFFIRYKDELGFHIRIRFHCNPNIPYHQIIDLLLERIKQNKLIYKLITSLQIDTYEKEMIRYGKRSIEKIEKIFYIDSTICLCILEAEKDINIRWLKSIALVSLYLKLAGMSHQRSFSIMEKCANSFATVFNPNKKEFKKINEFYATNKHQIRKYCEEPEANLNLPIQFITFLTNQLDELKHSSRFKKEPDLNNIYKDIIHMSLNRILTTNPNKNEFIIYEILKIFYKSSFYR